MRALSSWFLASAASAPVRAGPRPPSRTHIARSLTVPSVSPSQRSAANGASRQVTVAAKKCRVAINGFGRIGRQFLRCWEGRDSSNLEIVCINDSGGVKQASHLLKYDSTMGTFKADVKVTGDDTMTVNGKEIKIVSSRDPLQLPWAAMDIDIVIASISMPSLFLASLKIRKTRASRRMRNTA